MKQRLRKKRMKRVLLRLFTVHPAAVLDTCRELNWRPPTWRDIRLTSRHRPEVRCPTSVRYPDDLVGCGSTDVAGPDEEGLYDCRNCGLFFRE
jgi:hypothetical protein